MYRAEPGSVQHCPCDAVVKNSFNNSFIRNVIRITTKFQSIVANHSTSHSNMIKIRWQLLEVIPSTNRNAKTLPSTLAEKIQRVIYVIAKV